MSGITSVVLTAISFWLAVRNHTPSEPPPDPLALELRRFRTLTDDRERIEAIRQLRKVQDTRVTVVLMEVVQAELAKDRHGSKDPPLLLEFASGVLVHYHIPEEEWLTSKYWNVVSLWWEKHEVEVRRQAAALPQ